MRMFIKNKGCFFLLVFFLFSIISVNAQNPREEQPVGVSLQIAGPGVLTSVSLDAFIWSTVNIEVGIELPISSALLGEVYFGGIKYHFNGNSENKVTPYLGVFLSAFNPIDYDDEYPRQTGYLYIPIGFQFLSLKGFHFSMEAAGRFDKSKTRQNSIFKPYFGLKIGFHISKKGFKNEHRPEKEPIRNEDYYFNSN